MQGSEGIQMDYVAIFIVVLFPGALVAFNYDSLLALPHFSSLRVYCAGIWHNAVVRFFLFYYYSFYFLNIFWCIQIISNSNANANPIFGT